MREYFNCHNHTMYSNIRLLDSINRPKDLVKKAIELGLSGIAITDHDTINGLSKAMEEGKKLGVDIKIQREEIFKSMHSL